jgi:hypothetical protein
VQTSSQQIDRAETDHDNTYFVNVEGTEHPWPRSTITTEEISELGGWDASQGVIEIDNENNERTLRPGEVVELKPGHGFGKKIRFRRG